MPRLSRDYVDGAVYHLTARGVPELRVLGEDVDRQDFSLRLRRTAVVDRWLLHAACLMETHYHLVLSAVGDAIPRGMRVLNGGFARAFNARHGRRGSVFEARYTVTPIRDEEHLVATILYVEANPVRAGIVETVEDWPWSTHASSPLRALLERCLTP